jgi:hypothetical protein
MKWFVRLYPRRWRERYEDEFLAAIEQHHLSMRDRLDIVSSASRTWFNPRFRYSPHSRQLTVRTAATISVCIASLSVVSVIGIVTVEPILLILLALKFFLAGAILTLAVRVYRRTPVNNFSAPWRHAVRAIGTVGSMLIIAYGVSCLRSGTLVAPILGVYLLAVIGVPMLILIALYAIWTAVIRRPLPARR